jgi:hypothetical protein
MQIGRRLMRYVVFFTVAQAACMIQAVDRPLGVLHASGATMVNGSASASTTAVFNGDAVQTISGVVTISSPGSTVLVPSSSELKLLENSVKLGSGTVSINTTKGMAAQADALTIAPRLGGTAKFDVKRSGDLVTIHATSGVLSVNTASSAFSVPEGQTASFHVGDGTPSSAIAELNTHSNGSAGDNGSLFNLDKELSSGAGKENPCGSLICHYRRDVSGFKPCKCINP